MENCLKRKARRVTVVKQRKPKPSLQNGFGFEMPPDPQLVEIYFDQKGYPDQASVFFQFYDEMHWASPKGTPYRNWKTLATDWVYDFEQEAKLRRRLAANKSVFNDL